MQREFPAAYASRKPDLEKGGNQVQVLSTRRLKAPQGPIGPYHTPVLGRTPLRPWLAREALPFES